jgi:hypothetical protein
MGSVGAVRMREGSLMEILADAPAAAGDIMTLGALQTRMNQEGFGSVVMITDERTYHEPVDGGSDYADTYYVPADGMAFQPANGIVGATHFAPVTRAFDFGIGDGDVDNVRDFTIFYSEQNSGKTLKIEAQANAITLPNEGSLYVVRGL